MNQSVSVYQICTPQPKKKRVKRNSRKTLTSLKGLPDATVEYVFDVVTSAAAIGRWKLRKVYLAHSEASGYITFRHPTAGEVKVRVSGHVSDGWENG